MSKEYTQEFNDYLKEWIIKMSKLATEFQPVFRQFANGLKRFIEEAPESFFELSKYGWYIDLDLTPREIIELSDLLKHGKESEVDKFLSKHYIQNLDTINERLQNNYPKRKKIFKEAFQNHNNKCYYASITILLTQVDGICFDRTNNFFFVNNQVLKRKKIYRPAFEEILKKHSSEFSELFMSPLNEPTAINEHLDKLNNWPIRLNRHEILHGINMNYGNEINSLKVISFVNYIDNLLSDIE